MNIERFERRRTGGLAILLLSLIVAAGAHAVGGCSRRTNERSAAGSVADTLPNGLPRTLAPKLTSWVQAWHRALPEFASESLTRSDTRPFKFDYAWAGAGPIGSTVRTEALIDVLSPDSTRSLDFDMYLSFADGDPEPIREPDSAPVLADFKSDTLWRVAFCGTSCFYDGAYWVDADRFALTGVTGTTDQAAGPWRAFLDIYDLRSRTLTRWLAAVVEAPQFDRYQAASDSALADRVERAGSANGAGSTAESRVGLWSHE